MKISMKLLSAAVIFALIFTLAVAPLQAAQIRPPFPWFHDPCKPFNMPVFAFVSVFNNIPIGPPPVPEAPVYHTDGRLNYMVCRAPLALFMNEDGSVEIWSTNPDGLYAPLTLEISATAEEIAAALALAAELGQDVIIDGYVDGFALIAKADGTLKAELLGEYGCDFEADGEANFGWCLGFEEWVLPNIG